ncbi:uncharacterized protein LOC144445613 [Glandiceps talaboti]
METKDLATLQFSLPVLSVIVLVGLVFVFGFKSTTPPPSFDFDGDDKKSRRRRARREKDQRPAINGDISSEDNIKRKPSPSPISRGRDKTEESTSQPSSPREKIKKQQNKVKKTLEEENAWKRKKGMQQEENQLQLEQQPKSPQKVKQTSVEETVAEDEGEWITPMSRREKKLSRQQQKEEEAAAKKTELEERKSTPRSPRPVSERNLNQDDMVDIKVEKKKKMANDETNEEDKENREEMIKDENRTPKSKRERKAKKETKDEDSTKTTDENPVENKTTDENPVENKTPEMKDSPSKNKKKKNAKKIPDSPTEPGSPTKVSGSPKKKLGSPNTEKPVKSDEKLEVDSHDKVEKVKTDNTDEKMESSPKKEKVSPPRTSAPRSPDKKTKSSLKKVPSSPIKDIKNIEEEEAITTVQASVAANETNLGTKDSKPAENEIDNTLTNKDMTESSSKDGSQSKDPADEDDWIEAKPQKKKKRVRKDV